MAQVTAVPGCASLAGAVPALQGMVLHMGKLGIVRRMQRHNYHGSTCAECFLKACKDLS